MSCHKQLSITGITKPVCKWAQKAAITSVFLEVALGPPMPETGDWVTQWMTPHLGLPYTAVCQSLRFSVCLGMFICHTYQSRMRCDEGVRQLVKPRSRLGFMFPPGQKLICTPAPKGPGTSRAGVRYQRMKTRSWTTCGAQKILNSYYFDSLTQFAQCSI